MLLALALLACPAPTPPEAAADLEASEIAPDPMNVQIHTLANGLTVYLSENHEEARINARVAVRAGGAVDPNDATGMAHYLEHMLANKGTQRLGSLDYEAERVHLDRIRELFDALNSAETDEEAAAIYAELDAEGLKAQQYVLPNELKQIYGLLGSQGLNAFTNQDSTQYINDIPANALEAWAHLEGDRFGGAVFRAFQTEVETVYEEKNRAMDNPSRAIYSALSQALYGGHPYGREVLGTIEHLKRPSVSKTEAYFDTWYVPNNMAVILAGDFDSAEALALIEEHLGGLEAKPLPEDAKAPPAPLSGESRVEIVHNDVDMVYVAWLTVPFAHGDHAALVVMDMLMSNGKTGLLDKLKIEQRVRSASSYPSRQPRAGTQVVYGIPREGQTVEEVESLLLDAVAQLKAGAFTQADIDAVVTDFQVSEQQQLEANGARVSKMAGAFIMEDDWEHYRTSLDRVAKVTREDVMAAAERYLGEDRVVAVRRQGKPELPTIQAPPITERPLNTTEHSAFFTEVLGIERPTLSPQTVLEGEDYARLEAPFGVVYAAGNPFNDLASLTLRWEMGTAHRPDLCVGMSLWKRSGVGDRSLVDLERWLYANGTSFSTSCGQHTASVTFSGPRAALPELVSTMVERLNTPALPESEREAALADLLKNRQEKKTTQNTRLSALASYAQRGAESPWLDDLSDEALLARDTADYLAGPASLLNTAYTAFYVGNDGEAELLAMLPASPDGDYAPPPEREPRRYVQPEADRVLFLHHESVQASIAIYVPEEDYTPTRYPLYTTWRSYMGGSAGLVFQEIREARGLAYSAGGSYSEAGWLGDQNLASTRASVQADKAVEALELMMGFARGHDLDPERFERARDTAAQGNRVRRTGFRSVPSKAWAWEKVEIPGDARVGWSESIEALTVEELQAFADRWADRPVTIAILGDRERLDMAAIGAIAPIEELTMDDLVSY